LIRCSNPSAGSGTNYVTIPDGQTIFDFKLSKTEILKKHKLTNKIIIGYIGTLENHEGIEYILRCIKMLADNRITFVVIGDGPYKTTMLEVIATLGISESILYLGKLKYVDASQRFLTKLRGIVDPEEKRKIKFVQFSLTDEQKKLTGLAMCRAEYRGSGPRECE
jgi:glycosyltransferase involved in cell wall biosynthesis